MAVTTQLTWRRWQLLSRQHTGPTHPPPMQAPMQARALQEHIYMNAPCSPAAGSSCSCARRPRRTPPRTCRAPPAARWRRWRWGGGVGMEREGQMADRVPAGRRSPIPTQRHSPPAPARCPHHTRSASRRRVLRRPPPRHPSPTRLLLGMRHAPTRTWSASSSPSASPAASSSCLAAARSFAITSSSWACLNSSPTCRRSGREWWERRWSRGARSCGARSARGFCARQAGARAPCALHPPLSLARKHIR